MSKTLKTYEVSVEPIEETSGKELSDTFYHNCLFCEKLVKVSPNNFKSCLNLGGGKFHCPFCLRNNFNYRSSRNVLIVSFRAIIGQYYYKHFLESPPSHQRRGKMWLSEIEYMIERHERIGLKCPVLSYDPSTYLWFADFNKVGTSLRKAPFEEVNDTAGAILTAFNLDGVFGSYVFDGMLRKYEKALKTFYEKRKRPEGRRMLIPTLHSLVHGHKDGFFDKARDFVPGHLQTI